MSIVHAIVRLALDECELLNVGGEAYIVCPVNDSGHYRRDDEWSTMQVHSEEFTTWLSERFRARYGQQPHTIGGAILTLEQCALQLNEAPHTALPWHP